MSYLLTCCLTLLPTTTMQVKETLKYDGKEYAIYELPLSPWLAEYPKKRKHFTSICSACWRGYHGTWKISEKTLFVDELTQADFETKIALDDFFSTDFFPLEKGPIKAEWFTGVIRLGDGKKLKDGMGWFPLGIVYEKDIYFTIKKGTVVSKNVVNNRRAGRFLSIDDRKRVFGAEKAVDVGSGWVDARSINENATVRTRGILNTSVYRSGKEGKEGKVKRTEMWIHIPQSPEGDGAILDLILPESMDLPEDDSFVEVDVKYSATSKRYHVTTLRLLDSCETIHHPSFSGTK